MFEHCLYFNTTALARVVEREWSQAFKPWGLTPPQGFLLRLVLGRPGLTQREVAEQLTISRPTATRLIDGVQALGFLDRRDSGPDARHWALFPTSRAQAIKDALNAASAAVTQRVQRHIGKQNFQETVAQARTVRAALK